MTHYTVCKPFLNFTICCSHVWLPSCCNTTLHEHIHTDMTHSLLRKMLSWIAWKRVNQTLQPQDPHQLPPPRHTCVVMQEHMRCLRRSFSEEPLVLLYLITVYLFQKHSPVSNNNDNKRFYLSSLWKPYMMVKHITQQKGQIVELICIKWLWYCMKCVFV